MFDLNDLYQEVIVDHNRSPRNFGKLSGANRRAEGYNPLCGDRITLYLKVNEGIVEDVKFEGSGCAISIATASLMTESVIGKPEKEALDLFHEFHDMLVCEHSENARDKLGKLSILEGVRAFPSRIKCATLCWHTLDSAIENKGNKAVTE